MPSGRSPPPASGSSPVALDQADTSSRQGPRAGPPANLLHPPPAKNVLTANLVVEQIEAEGGLSLRLAIELPLKALILSGVSRLITNHPHPRHLRKRARSQEPFLRRNYPASTVVRPCPTPARSIANRDVEAATSERTGLPDYPDHPSSVPCPITPADRDRCACRLLPCPMRPSPNLRRVGVRNFTFEACAGFTHVTARWIAQPPKAAFVARFRSDRLPSRAACQLPDQPTIIWMEPASIGDPRRRGALRS